MTHAALMHAMTTREFIQWETYHVMVQQAEKKALRKARRGKRGGADAG